MSWRRYLYGLLSIGIILSFFLPWAYLEVVPVKGYALRYYAAEYFPPLSWQMALVYSLYLVPVMGIYLLTATLLRVNLIVWHIKLIAFLLVMAFLGMLYYYSGSLNLRVGAGVVITAICTLGMVLMKMEASATDKLSPNNQ